MNKVPSYECIEKLRNKAGNVDSYKLRDNNGNIIIIPHDILKTQISTNQIHVVNLRVTSNNRLITTGKNRFYQSISEVKPCSSTPKTYQRKISNIGVASFEPNEILVLPLPANLLKKSNITDPDKVQRALGIYTKTMQTTKDITNQEGVYTVQSIGFYKNKQTVILYTSADEVTWKHPLKGTVSKLTDYSLVYKLKHTLKLFNTQGYCCILPPCVVDLEHTLPIFEQKAKGLKAKGQLLKLPQLEITKLILEYKEGYNSKGKMEGFSMHVLPDIYLHGTYMENTYTVGKYRLVLVRGDELLCELYVEAPLRELRNIAIHVTNRYSLTVFDNPNSFTNLRFGLASWSVMEVN